MRSHEKSDEMDVRQIYCYLLVSKIVAGESLCTKAENGGFTKYLLNCQNYDGGFGLLPDSESHGGATFCALSSLRLLGHELSTKRGRLLEWLINRSSMCFNVGR